jgi:integrase
VAANTGNDPVLDSLVLRLHTETACRRGGALALTPADLDTTQCLIMLREKGETVRWQPVSPTLMNHLTRHVEEHQTPPTEPLLRAYTGPPITARQSSARSVAQQPVVSRVSTIEGMGAQMLRQARGDRLPTQRATVVVKRPPRAGKPPQLSHPKRSVSALLDQLIRHRVASPTLATTSGVRGLLSEL